MKQQEILKKIQDIILPYLEKPCEIKMETNLLKDLELNSVDIVNIIVEIEDDFQCEIEDAQIPNMYLIKDIIQYIINSIRE